MCVVVDANFNNEKQISFFHYIGVFFLNNVSPTKVINLLLLFVSCLLSTFPFSSLYLFHEVSVLM